MAPKEKNESLELDQNQETSALRETWETPRLVEHGSAEKLTEGVGTIGSDVTNFSA